MCKKYQLITFCEVCGEKIIIDNVKLTSLKERYYCSQKCSDFYKIKAMFKDKKKEWKSKRKYYNREVDFNNLITLYEQFVYKYYRKLLAIRSKEERISDAYYCFIKMMDEEGINDVLAYTRAIRRYAHSEKQRLHYEYNNWKNKRND